MPEIPPFIRVVTKDIYEILELMDMVIEGKITFPDGRPVQTVGIDGMSVLWSVRQEVGDLKAKNRAKRQNRKYDPDNSRNVQLDWVDIKKPLKRLHAKFNASNIKYLITTARSKDLYEKKPNGDLEKVGFTVDAMRGLEYEANLVLQMHTTVPWTATVQKSHGALGVRWPKGTVVEEFPASEILEYSTGGGVVIEGDVEVAERQAERESRSKAALAAYGREKGLSPAEVKAVLEESEISYDASRWDEMIAAIDSAV
jgi:hypothetical protein